MLALIVPNVACEDAGNVLVRQFQRARFEPGHAVFGCAEKRGDEHSVYRSRGVGASLVVGHVEVVFAGEETGSDADSLLTRVGSGYQCHEGSEKGGEW